MSIEVSNERTIENDTPQPEGLNGHKLPESTAVSGKHPLKVEFQTTIRKRPEVVSTLHAKYPGEWKSIELSLGRTSAIKVAGDVLQVTLQSGRDALKNLLVSLKVDSPTAKIVVPVANNKAPQRNLDPQTLNRIETEIFKKFRALKHPFAPLANSTAEAKEFERDLEILFNPLQVSADVRIHARLRVRNQLKSFVSSIELIRNDHHRYLNASAIVSLERAISISQRSLNGAIKLGIV